MPIYRRVTLILMLCALVLGACKAQPTEEAATPMPTLAQQEAPADREEAPADPADPEGAPEEAPEDQEAPTEPAAPTEPEPTVEPAETEAPVDLLDPTATPEPEETAEAADPEEVETLQPEEEEAADEEPEPSQAEDATAQPEAETPQPEETKEAGVVIPGAVVTLPADDTVALAALAIRADEAVAPPLSLHVSANRQIEGYRFKVSGLMRNDAAEPYAGLGVIATFFRDDGSRYGPVRAQIQCPILGPGDVCPFIVETTDKHLAEVMLHAEGHPTDRRQPAPVELTTTGRYVDGIGYVHITGSVTNPNPVAIQDVTINGALLDNGQIVSLGADLLIGPIEPNATARFDVTVRYVPYTETQLYVQALPPR